MQNQQPNLDTGEAIRAFREAIGWSQAKLAEQAGTTQQTVDRIESGQTTHSRALPAIKRVLADQQVWLSERDLGIAEIAARQKRQQYISKHTPVPSRENRFPVFNLVDKSRLLFGFYSEIPHAFIDRPATYSVTVTTDELLPVFPRGDLLFIDVDEEPAAGQMIAATFRLRRRPGDPQKEESDAHAIGYMMIGALIRITADRFLMRDGDKELELAIGEWIPQVIVRRVSITAPNAPIETNPKMG